jgi:hypothetical protein
MLEASGPRRSCSSTLRSLFTGQLAGNSGPLRAGSALPGPRSHFDGFEHFRERYSRVLVDHCDVRR